MLKVLAAFALALASSAGAAASMTVKVDGVEHGTGLLQRPADAPRTFYAPAKQALEALPEAYSALTETQCIPAVRNQGSCGSCWSFATEGAFETASCLAGKPLTDLAEQDALVNDRSAYGCQGGFMDGTFLTQQGSATEAACPYKANDRVACNGAKWGKATRWALLGASGRAPTDDELAQGIVDRGSLFVTVAAGSGFSPRNGRITSCGSTQVNHMVQIVAYRPAADGGREFLIKNSWGTSWGGGDGAPAGYAWSKRGCNKLASTPGDAAGFFYVEGSGPQPLPSAAVKGLAEEYVVAKGNPIVFALLPAAEPGYKVRWSIGGAPELSGWKVSAQSTTSTTGVVKVTDPKGNVTEKTFKITVK